MLSTLKQKLPAIHLIAVAIFGTLLTLTLWLMPSEPVSATKIASNNDTLNTQPLALSERIKSLSESEATINAQVTQPHTPKPVNNTPPQLPPEKPENWVTYKVQKNDNLTSLFKRAGLTATDVYYVSKSTNEEKTLSRLYPGQSLSFLIEEGHLKKVKYVQSALKTAYIVRQPDSKEFTLSTVERTPETVERYAEGIINSSLFVDAEKAGLSGNMIMQLAAVFGWDVDFTQDIRNGDSFRLIYNEQFLDGKKISDGHIVAAEFVNQDRKMTAIRFTDSEGASSYYTPDGKSMRKAFLRMPVDFARVSSRFNLKRKHPVLNKIRAHKGVDYAARTGTPIKASGDGKVIWKGTKGGYGRTIILKHGGNITTLYAHMSRYNKKLKNGSRVKQGQVIGYIGKSGLATGPHLHYEFRVNGSHRNPMTVKFPHASPVPKKERNSFNEVATLMTAQLDSYTDKRLALKN